MRRQYIYIYLLKKKALNERARIAGADNDVSFPQLRLRQAKELQQQEEKRAHHETLRLGPVEDESLKPVVLEGEIKEIRATVTAFITCVQEVRGWRR